MSLHLVKETKECLYCKQVLPVEYYSVNRENKDGLQSKCRECDNAYQRNRRKKPEVKKKIKQYGIEYRERRRNDNDWRLKQLYQSARARALSKDMEFDLTPEFLESIYPTNGRCPVYGTILKWGNSGFREHSPSIDRINSSRGYTQDNVQIISWKANRLKSYATLEDLEILVAFMRQGE